MSALTTRMLVLGAVQTFGPANGYQLRRELLSWDVERWAYLNPGSIYSMLSTLEKQRAIARHDLTIDARAVVVYTVTDDGRTEFEQMIYDALAKVPDSGDVLPLRVAMNFGPVLTRERFLQAVAERADYLTRGMVEFHAKVDALRLEPLVVPPQVVSELDLELMLAQAQLDWLLTMQKEVQGGGLVFAGDAAPAHWAPPADDPGWRMAEERSRYLEEIERRA